MVEEKKPKTKISVTCFSCCFPKNSDSPCGNKQKKRERKQRRERNSLVIPDFCTAERREKERFVEKEEMVCQNFKLAKSRKADPGTIKSFNS